MILVGTAPRGGEDIMHLEKPSLSRHLGDSTLKGYAVLQKIFFAPTSSSQAAGGAFIERLARRTEDLDSVSRLLHPAGVSIPRVGRAVRAVLESPRECREA